MDSRAPRCRPEPCVTLRSQRQSALQGLRLRRPVAAPAGRVWRREAKGLGAGPTLSDPLSGSLSVEAELGSPTPCHHSFVMCPTSHGLPVGNHSRGSDGGNSLGNRGTAEGPSRPRPQRPGHAGRRPGHLRTQVMSCEGHTASAGPRRRSSRPASGRGACGVLAAAVGGPGPARADRRPGKST